MTVDKWNKSLNDTLSNCEKNTNVGSFPAIIDFKTKSEIIYLSKTEQFQMTIAHNRGKRIDSKVPDFVTISENSANEYKISLDIDYRPHFLFFLTEWAKGKDSKKMDFVDSFVEYYDKWMENFHARFFKQFQHVI